MTLGCICGQEASGNGTDGADQGTAYSLSQMKIEFFRLRVAIEVPTLVQIKSSDQDPETEIENRERDEPGGL